MRYVGKLKVLKLLTKDVLTMIYLHNVDTLDPIVYL